MSNQLLSAIKCYVRTVKPTASFAHVVSLYAVMHDIPSAYRRDHKLKGETMALNIKARDTY